MRDDPIAQKASGTMASVLYFRLAEAEGKYHKPLHLPPHDSFIAPGFPPFKSTTNFLTGG